MPTPIPAARSTSRCAPGSSPSQIVFTGVGKTDRRAGPGHRSRRPDDQRRVGRRDRARIDALVARAADRTKIADPRSIPTWTPRPTRTSRPASRSTSSASPLDDVRPLSARARGLAGVEIVGLHAHVGSQITDMEPLDPCSASPRRSRRRAPGRRHANRASRHRRRPRRVVRRLGGCPTARDYANAVLPIVRESGLAIVLEPGRQIIAPAGALLTRVIDVKPGRGRPVLRDHGRRDDGDHAPDALRRVSPHRARHAERRRRRSPATSSVRFARAATHSGRTGRCRARQVGELYAVLDTGAYGSVMASNYNRRLLPPEVLVENGVARIIRRRQTLDDVLALEA